MVLSFLMVLLAFAQKGEHSNVQKVNTVSSFLGTSWIISYSIAGLNLSLQIKGLGPYTFGGFFELVIKSVMCRIRPKGGGDPKVWGAKMGSLAGESTRTFW
jgi:hypothetical protein